jgi:hypothetical protein
MFSKFKITLFVGCPQRTTSTSETALNFGEYFCGVLGKISSLNSSVLEFLNFPPQPWEKLTNRSFQK